MKMVTGWTTIQQTAIMLNVLTPATLRLSSEYRSPTFCQYSL